MQKLLKHYNHNVQIRSIDSCLTDARLVFNSEIIKVFVNFLSFILNLEVLDTI